MNYETLPIGLKHAAERVSEQNGTDLFYFDTVTFGLGFDLLLLRKNLQQKEIIKVLDYLGFEGATQVVPMAMERLYNIYAKDMRLLSTVKGDDEKMRDVFKGIKKETISRALEYSWVFKIRVEEMAKF